MQKAIVLILICLSSLFAVPTLYHIKRLPSGFMPTINGDVSEWTSTLFVDSLDGNENVFARNGAPWTRDEIQYQVWAAFDDAWVYAAVKVVADDAPRIGNTEDSYDNLTLNIGGREMAMRIMSGGELKGPSSPFNNDGGSGFVGRVDSIGNYPFPTYECAMSLVVLDPFGMGTFQLSIGVQDEDTINRLNTCWTGVGVSYLEDTLIAWNSNTWDNPKYYPTFDMTHSGVEAGKSAEKEASFLVHPNPFNPTTSIEYNTWTSGKSVLSIFNVSGAKVFSREVLGQGRVSWNAAGLASGTYLVRLSMGSKTLQKRILYLK